jgi:hypothetical protein
VQISFGVRVSVNKDRDGALVGHNRRVFDLKGGEKRIDDSISQRSPDEYAGLERIRGRPFQRDSCALGHQRFLAQERSQHSPC